MIQHLHPRHLDFDREPTFVDMVVNAPPDTIVVLVECGVLNPMEVIQLDGLAEASSTLLSLQEGVLYHDIPEPPR